MLKNNWLNVQEKNRDLNDRIMFTDMCSIAS